MPTRRYHAGGGTVRCFGSHRIRHATATLLGARAAEALARAGVTSG